MSDNEVERRLRQRLHQAIAPDLPGAAAADAVLRALHHQTSTNAVPRPILRRLGTIAGAGAAFVVFAGLLAFAVVVVRHQANPAAPHPAQTPPAVSSPVAPGCSPGSSGSGCASATPATPTPAANPPSSLLDLTWVSDETGWALGRTSCAGTSCAQVFSTADGGQTWHVLPDPGATTPPICGGASCPVSAQSTAPLVSHIRFANANVGYLWGPSLLMTVDGGRTWQVQAATNIEALEPSGGSAYRVEFDHTGCPGPCNTSVWKTTVGSSVWQKMYSLPAPPSRGVRTTLAVVGEHTVYATTFGSLAAGGGTQQAVIYRSLDGAATWTTISDPCLRTNAGSETKVAVDVAAAPGGFVTALCASRSAASPGYSVVTSGTSGTSWGALEAVPTTSVLQIIAAADASHLAVATGPVSGSGPRTYVVYNSTDGGIHWTLAASDTETPAPGDPPVAFLGFESATTGRWAQASDAVWSTADGGVHWTRRGFPG